MEIYLSNIQHSLEIYYKILNKLHNINITDDIRNILNGYLYSLDNLNNVNFDLDNHQDENLLTLLNYYFLLAIHNLTRILYDDNITIDNFTNRYILFHNELLLLQMNIFH